MLREIMFAFAALQQLKLRVFPRGRHDDSKKNLSLVDVFVFTISYLTMTFRLMIMYEKLSVNTLLRSLG